MKHKVEFLLSRAMNTLLPAESFIYGPQYHKVHAVSGLPGCCANFPCLKKSRQRAKTVDVQWRCAELRTLIGVNKYNEFLGAMLLSQRCKWHFNPSRFF